MIQSLFGGSGGLASATQGLGALLPPLIAFGGGKTIFLATVPGASANFSQTLSAVRSAQRILLRAQDGKPATFFVGDRYPVSLALLSANVSAASSELNSRERRGRGWLPRTDDYNTDNGPVALAIADFNGAGHPDIIVANQESNTISLFLGAGDGTFPTRTDITVGKAPSAIAVGDFNTDNNMDIAVTNSGDNTVSILYGHGDGTFTAPVTYPTGTTPVGLAVKDFNNDGRPDLAIVNQADNTVSILLGQADGTFGAKTDYPVGTLPVAIASFDFNADGNAGSGRCEPHEQYGLDTTGKRGRNIWPENGFCHREWAGRDRHGRFQQ